MESQVIDGVADQHFFLNPGFGAGILFACLVPTDNQVFFSSV